MLIVESWNIHSKFSDLWLTKIDDIYYKLNKMPKNLSDYMNRNNISESSRNSPDDRQIGVGNGPA